MVEHLVESLAASGIQVVTLLCDDRPEEVVRHFGNGERWGCALTMSAVREQGGLQRMLRAALHGISGVVICLPGNMIVSNELPAFLKEVTAAENAPSWVPPEHNFIVIDAAKLLSLLEENRFESFDELIKLVREKVSLSPHDGKNLQSQTVSDLTGFISAQRDVLNGRLGGSRIAASLRADGVWIGDHVHISPDVRLVAPLFIGSHCQIYGNGQIGPNAVISPYCLVNNSDLICDSLIMSGTATGAHTELNAMAVQGRTLVNLCNGATVTSPDAFILGDIGDGKEHSSGDLSGTLLAAILMLLLLPLGLPLFFVSLLAPSLIRQERCLGNRRMKTLVGEKPRMSFNLRQFNFGPLLLRRWPGLVAVVMGNLTLVGAAPIPAGEAELREQDSIFGLDTARGLYHLWEVDGELPGSVDEQHVRENFHAVTRTLWSDLKILLKAAITFPSAV